MDRTSVLVADDHPMVREGIVHLLGKQADFEVVAEAADGEEAVRLAGELSPEVVLMDIEMPKVDGLEATRQIKSAHPETSVLVLTVHDDEEYVIGVLEAGAAGYLLKTAYGEELIQAIRAVRLGEFVLDPLVGRKVLRSLASRRSNLVHSISTRKLSAREIEVLRLVSQGKSNCEIAKALDISLGTAKGYLAEIFTKLGVGTRVEAIVTCLCAGILSLDDLSQ